jgi:hypothetical protein
MSERRHRLPNRRGCETFGVEHGGLGYVATVSYFDTNRPAEIFISNHKRGNAVDVAVRDAGILISLCLQHGCDIETITRAMTRNPDGSDSGVVGAVIDRILAFDSGEAR